MADRQRGNLYPPGGEIGVWAEEKRVWPLARKRCEGRVDLPAGAGVEDLHPPPPRTPRGFDLSHLRLRARRISRIDENGDTSHCGHQFAQKFQPLRHQFTDEEIDAREVAPRLGEASDEPKLDRV